MKDELFKLISQNVVPFVLMSTSGKPQMNTARIAEWLLLLTVLAGMFYMGLGDIKAEMKHLNTSLIRVETANADAHNKIEDRITRMENVFIKP